MAYLLPRTVLVLLAWALTCALIWKLARTADGRMFAVAGATWLVGAATYFAYLRKLRRDIEELGRTRGYFVDRNR